MIDCSNSNWRSAFNRARGTPKRPAIYAIGVEVQHPIIEFPGGGRPFYEPIEIANVLAGFLNDARAVIIADALMSRDHRAWIERLASTLSSAAIHSRRLSCVRDSVRY